MRPARTRAPIEERRIERKQQSGIAERALPYGCGIIHAHERSLSISAKQATGAQAGVNLPPPRKFSKEQMATWIAEDETEMQRFREGA
jgi:hypothetical protein